MQGQCRFCGQTSEGVAFEKWVKPTFTDFDKLQGGEIVCNACLFFFDEANEELAKRMSKDKPQRMRNYSHFIVNGEWIPLSKGNKDKMRELLLGDVFPELAAIAVCIYERWAVYFMRKKMAFGIAIRSIIGHGKMYGLIFYQKELIIIKLMIN